MDKVKLAHPYQNKEAKNKSRRQAGKQAGSSSWFPVLGRKVEHFAKPPSHPATNHHTPSGLTNPKYQSYRAMMTKDITGKKPPSDTNKAVLISWIMLEVR